MKQIVCLTLLIGVVSCGVQAPRETSYTISSTGEPFEYKHTQNSCEEIEPEKLLRTPTIKLFIDGKFKSVQMEKVSNEHLVDKLLLGGEVESGLMRSGKLKVKEKAVEFKYCFDPEKLDEKDYEDATLSILDPLNKFENRYLSLVRENNISKINIRVLPRYINVHSVRTTESHTLNKQTLVNNAMYAASRNEIIFLPQGKNQIGFIPFGGVPLWKQPMVTLHEYAHHFFRSLLGEKVAKDLGHLCIDNRHALELPQDYFSEDTSSERKVELDDVVGVLNEAFADLFSYYSNVDNKNLKNFGCMEKSRDVSSKMYISGTEKMLSRYVLDTFLSAETKKSGGCAVHPDYQKIHIVGAIYGWGFFKLLTRIDISQMDKLKLLLDWIKTIPPLYDLNPDPEKMLNSAAINFFRLASNRYPKLKSECQYFFATFPEADFQCE